MGVVYKAIDQQLNRPVAVKAVEDRRILMPGSSGRLRTEALAAASLDHPYICKVYELVETPTEAFIVMEFVEGETLSSILKRGVLPLLQTLQIGREIAEGPGRSALARPRSSRREAGQRHGDAERPREAARLRRGRRGRQHFQPRITRGRRRRTSPCTPARRSTWRRSRPPASPSRREPICFRWAWCSTSASPARCPSRDRRRSTTCGT